MTTAYERNEIMKLLGRQYSNLLINEESQEGIYEILEARGMMDYRKYIFDLVIDVFMYGYIRGKQAERQKKKAPL